MWIAMFENLSARKTQVDLVRFAIIFLYKPENMTYFGEKGFLVGPYRFKPTFKSYNSALWKKSCVLVVWLAWGFYDQLALQAQREPCSYENVMFKLRQTLKTFSQEF